MTKHEQIVGALTTALRVAEPTLARNAPMLDLSTAGTMLRLSDGQAPQVTETFLNPRSYEFTMTPVVLIVVSGGTDAERDATIETKTASLLDAIGEITDLGGMIFDIRPQPPNKAPKETFGAPDVTATEFEIEIDYESDSSAG